MIYIVFIPLNYLLTPVCPVDGGGVVLEEATPIRMEPIHRT